MKNIVIIGNGFDLSYGFKTSYYDFIENHLKKNNHYTDDDLFIEFPFLKKVNIDSTIKWSDIEEEYRKIIEELDCLKKDGEIIKINNSFSILERELYLYLKTTNNFIKKSVKDDFEISESFNDFIKKSEKIINFNYTKTLRYMCDKSKEKIMNSDIDKILHIHGDIINDDEIIMGYYLGEKVTEYNCVESYHNDKSIRRIDILRTMNFDTNGENFNLHILGHSMVGSDLKFLEKFIENANKIYVYSYEKDYFDKIASLRQYYHKNNKIWNDNIIVLPFPCFMKKKDDIYIRDYTEIQEISKIKIDDYNFKNNFFIENNSTVYLNIKSIVYDRLIINRENIEFLNSTLKVYLEKCSKIVFEDLDFKNIEDVELEIDVKTTISLFLKNLPIKVSEIEFSKCQIILDVNFLPENLNVYFTECEVYVYNSLMLYANELYANNTSFYGENFDNLSSINTELNLFRSNIIDFRECFFQKIQFNFSNINSLIIYGNVFDNAIFNCENMIKNLKCVSTKENYDSAKIGKLLKISIEKKIDLEEEIGFCSICKNKINESNHIVNKSDDKIILSNDQINEINGILSALQINKLSVDQTEALISSYMDNSLYFYMNSFFQTKPLSLLERINTLELLEQNIINIIEKRENE